MKLAEALMRRASLTEKCSLLENRANSNAFVQEGDEPADDPLRCLDEFKEINRELTELIARINRTNTKTSFRENETIADALTRRDSISRRLQSYTQLINSLTLQRPGFGGTEIRTVLLMDPKALQQQADSLRAEYEALDLELQCLNWQTDLL